MTNLKHLPLGSFVPLFLMRCAILGCLLLQLTACGEPVKKSLKDTTVLNYTNEPVIDVLVNDVYVGDAPPANASDSPGGGGGGVMTGVPFPVGEYEIKWTIGGPKGNPHLGETRIAKATLKEIPENAEWLQVQIHPDGVVKLVASHLMSPINWSN